MVSSAGWPAARLISRITFHTASDPTWFHYIGRINVNDSYFLLSRSLQPTPLERNRWTCVMIYNSIAILRPFAWHAKGSSSLLQYDICHAMYGIGQELICQNTETGCLAPQLVPKSLAPIYNSNWKIQLHRQCFILVLSYRSKLLTLLHRQHFRDMDDGLGSVKNSINTLFLPLDLVGCATPATSTMRAAVILLQVSGRFVEGERSLFLKHYSSLKLLEDAMNQSISVETLIIKQGARTLSFVLCGSSTTFAAADTYKLVLHNRLIPRPQLL